MIIIVFGLPGSGKTYFAKRLAKRINGRHISSDVIRKELFSNPTYSTSEKLKVYKVMFDIMYNYVKRKEPLVLDGTFYKASLRDNFIKEISQLGNEIKFIEVQAEESIIKERLKSQREDSDANFEIYKKLRFEFEPYNKDHLILHSTNENIEEMIEAGLSYLRNGIRGEEADNIQ